MRRLAALSLVLSLTSVSALAACNQDDIPDAATGPSGQASASGSATATASGTASAAPGSKQLVGQVDGIDVRADVRPVVRTEGASLVTVDLTVTGLSDSGVGIGSRFSDPFRDLGRVSFSEVRLVDPAARKVYLVAGNDKQLVATSSSPLSKVGSRLTVQAAFAALPATASSIDVLIGHLGYLRGVPVQDGEVPTDVNPSATPARLEQVRLSAEDLRAITSAPVLDLEELSTRVGGAVRERSTPKRVTINLDTAVLFPLDSATLTPRATAGLQAAAATIKQRGPGPVLVRGYTDDTGSTAHNLALSRARARTVAAALARQLGSAYPLRASGYGERDPQVPNTSEAARKLNRRVELTVDAPAAAATPTSSPTSATSAGGAASTTKLEPGTATGTDQVSPSSKLTGGRQLQIRPVSLERADGLLVLTLDVENTSASDLSIIGGMLSSGPISVRGAFSPREQYSANAVRLLVGDRATYPLDYQESKVRSTLAEQYLNHSLAASGGHQHVTVVFPDVAGTPAAVDVDVPGVLRLRQVPVTG